MTENLLVMSGLASLSFTLRAALRAVALSHARLRAGVTREVAARRADEGREDIG